MFFAIGARYPEIKKGTSGVTILSTTDRLRYLTRVLVNPLPNDRSAMRPHFGHLGRVACGAEAAVRSTTNVWRLRFRWRNLILYLVAQSRPTGPTMEYLHRYAAMQHRPTWCAAHLRDPDNDQSHVVRISNDATSCSRLQNSMLQGTIA